MAFDEGGQTATATDMVRIYKWSYDNLVNELLFPPENIIIYPNILTICTRMEEHTFDDDSYPL